MKIIRVFAGDDGESHFEDITPEQMVGIAGRLGAGDIQLNTRPSPSFLDFHNAPRRQYVVGLEGTPEVEIADGAKVLLEPGDILVAEDLTGHGHITRNLGDTPRTSLAVPLADPA